MSHESTLLLVLILGQVFSLVVMMHKQRVHLRSLDLKLDALLKAQGVEWPSFSPEVQAYLDSRRKIAAIKLHREEHPGLSIAEAKAEVEAFAAKKP